ncbi:hypothetical protein CMTB2_06841 [Caminibacter mediatlanticus TB-2]|uniref:Uncharacterized protein n=1 Tax=Caminibacter mediatlanticus TB-2 TaxID=391592 RepID=A0AAI9AHZ7_9BACT|nr:hypothetical protein CMTB2_06841 [Caminibacter mediatlanticus TB-2]
MNNKIRKDKIIFKLYKKKIELEKLENY